MDILQFAIDMERDGQKYYADQATLHLEDGLMAVFELLAHEEAAHAALLRSRRAGQPYQLNVPARADLKSVFHDLTAFRSNIKQNPSATDVYRMALEKEQQSIDLYEKLAGEGGDGKPLFVFLVEQEKEHYLLLDKIVKIVSRPETWVESTEFGIREEY